MSVTVRSYRAIDSARLALLAQTAPQRFLNMIDNSVRCQISNDEQGQFEPMRRQIFDWLYSECKHLFYVERMDQHGKDLQILFEDPGECMLFQLRWGSTIDR